MFIFIYLFIYSKYVLKGLIGLQGQSRWSWKDLQTSTRPPSSTNLHFSLLPSIHLIYTQCNKLSINRQINHGTSAYHKKPTHPVAISLFCQNVKIVQKHKNWETDSGQPIAMQWDRRGRIRFFPFCFFARSLVPAARSWDPGNSNMIETMLWVGGRRWESTRVLILLLIRARFHLASSSLASWSELGGDWGDDDEHYAGGRLDKFEKHPNIFVP